MMSVGDLEFETVSTDEQHDPAAPAEIGTAADPGLIGCCIRDHARAEGAES
jgi:hypothetical protein